MTETNAGAEIRLKSIRAIVTTLRENCHNATPDDREESLEAYDHVLKLLNAPIAAAPDAATSQPAHPLIAEARERVIETCRAVCHAAKCYISLEQVNSNIIHRMYNAMNELERQEREPVSQGAKGHDPLFGQVEFKAAMSNEALSVASNWVMNMDKLSGTEEKIKSLAYVIEQNKFDAARRAALRSVQTVEFEKMNEKRQP